jgi:hypothetical protein
MCKAQAPQACQYVIDNLLPPTAANTADLDVQIKSFVNIPEQEQCLWQLLNRGDALTEDRKNATVRAAIQKAFNTQKNVNTTQTGSSPGSGGTTSAVSKPSTPMSAASEFGGITASTNAQTITLQTPLDGIPRALASQGLVPYCSTPVMAVTLDGECVSNSLLNRLDRIGVGVSLNTGSTSKTASGSAAGANQGTTQQVSLTSLGTKVPSLAGIFVKFAAVKSNAKVKLPDPSTVVARPEGAAAAALMSDLGKNKNYSAWQDCLLAKLRGAAAEQRAEVFAKYYSQIVDVLLWNLPMDCGSVPRVSKASETINPSTLPAPQREFLDHLEEWIASAELVQAKFDEAVSKAAAAPILSIEYDYNTPQNQPTNSTFKLVGSVSWGKAVAPAGAPAKGSSPAPTPPWTLTYNAGASIYNYTPASTIPGSSLLRDVQVGAELDRNIASSKWPGILKKIGDSTASATYYFQYQSSPSILNVTPGSPFNGITITGLPSTATQIFTQKGDIHVGQLKWGLGKGKNVKFPIAVTYSNRTELITHPAWGLQFGVSYDLSALMGTGSSK